MSLVFGDPKLPSVWLPKIEAPVLEHRHRPDSPSNVMKTHSQENLNISPSCWGIYVLWRTAQAVDRLAEVCYKLDYDALLSKKHVNPSLDLDDDRYPDFFVYGLMSC